MPTVDKDFKGVCKILVEEHNWRDGDEFVPSMQDFTRLRKWVCWEDGLDANNRVIGFCPLHDHDRKDEGSAVFDFVKGMFWCNGDPTCHQGRRAMSIYNMYLACAELFLK